MYRVESTVNSLVFFYNTVLANSSYFYCAFHFWILNSLWFSARCDIANPSVGYFCKEPTERALLNDCVDNKLTLP